jgi:hypothetical protein
MVFQEAQSKEVFDRLGIDFLRPAEVKAFQSFDHRKTGGLDPTLDFVVGATTDFAADLFVKVIVVRPLFVGCFFGDGFKVFFDVSQFEYLDLFEQLLRFVFFLHVGYSFSSNRSSW